MYRPGPVLTSTEQCLVSMSGTKLCASLSNSTSRSGGGGGRGVV